MRVFERGNIIMHMMNSGFINRNRIYWMNTRGVAEIKVLINDDLFSL